MKEQPNKTNTTRLRSRTQNTGAPNEDIVENHLT